jgi:hypothetical protein
MSLHTKIEDVFICSSSFSERQRKWKEELAEELERTRGKFFVLSTVEKCCFPFLSLVGLGTALFPFSLWALQMPVHHVLEVLWKY